MLELLDQFCTRQSVLSLAELRLLATQSFHKNAVQRQFDCRKREILHHVQLFWQMALSAELRTQQISLVLSAGPICILARVDQLPLVCE